MARLERPRRAAPGLGRRTGLLGDTGGVLMVVYGADRAWQCVRRRTQTGAHCYCWSIGIGLAPEYRGRGYFIAVQRLLARYLFAHTQGVNRVQAETEITNAAEQRALEKAGFTLRGRAARRRPSAPGTAMTRSSTACLGLIRATLTARSPGRPALPGAMFTPEGRERLRAALVSAAGADERITCALRDRGAAAAARRHPARLTLSAWAGSTRCTPAKPGPRPGLAGGVHDQPCPACTSSRWPACGTACRPSRGAAWTSLPAATAAIAGALVRSLAVTEVRPAPFASPPRA